MATALLWQESAAEKQARSPNMATALLWQESAAEKQAREEKEQARLEKLLKRADRAVANAVADDAKHANRERRRQGTVAFERRVDAVVTEVASGKRQDERWDQLERVDVGQAKEMLDRSNKLFHGTEDKQFVQLWRS